MVKPWVIVPVCVLAFVGLRLVVQAFKNPSGSMYPTLEVGDHLFVTKIAYGLFSNSEPARGDVIVFDFPDAHDDQTVQYLKRTIALPGDTLVVESGHPIINGWRVPNCFVSRIQADALQHGGAELELFVEFLGEAAYLVVIDTARHDERQGPWVVPENEVFVLGDNRSNSSDSRVWFGGKGGGVPFEKIGGRASIVWWPRCCPSIHEVKLPRLVPSPDKELAACLAKRPKPGETKPLPRRIE